MVPESEEKYRHFFENLSDAVIVVDAETGLILEANKQAAMLLGKSRKEILGMSKLELHPLDKADEYKHSIADIVKKTHFVTYDAEVVNKQGEVVPVTASYSALTIGKRRLVLGLFRNITERKKMEEELGQSEANFKAIAESANVGIIIVARDGRFLYANRRAAEMTGQNKRNLREVHIDLHFHPDESKKILSALKRKLPVKGVPRRYETLLRRKDESSFSVEYTMSKTIWQKEAALLVILRDISEQHRSRENLRSYVKEVTRAQEEERKRIARDLHNGTAQSLASLCLEIEAISRGEEQLSEKTIQRLDHLRDKTDSIMEGVRRVSQELRPEVLDQLGMIPGLEFLVRGLTAQINIKAHVEVSGSERRLSADTELTLFRIVQEALYNIKKHSKATEAVVRIEFNPRKVKVTVMDNGKGFGLPLALSELGSMGKLGLIGMRERAHLLNASFSIQSKPSKGTKIIVEVAE